MHILDLPNVILVEILECLSYDEVAKKRLVCRRFDAIAQQVLNGGFQRVVKQHGLCFKRIKSLLPRRESERRNHCLARHSDILTSVETRISMLSMTYAKYMDADLCCFIPGRVLDEILRILRLISKANKPLRPHDVLQELRDISSMAIEHFDENIAHILKKFNDRNKYSELRCMSFCGVESRFPNSLYAATLPIFSANVSYALDPKSLGTIGDRLVRNSPKTTSNDSESPQQTLPSTSKGSLERQHPVGDCSEACTTMENFKKLESEYKKSISKMHRMEQVQNLQNKRLQDTLNSVAELSVQLVELKKRLEDVDAKNREISANIKNMNGGDSTKFDNILNNTTTKLESNNSVEGGTLSSSPNTSSAAAKPLDKSSNKRHIGAEIRLPSREEDDIKKTEDNHEAQQKKRKVQT